MTTAIVLTLALLVPTIALVCREHPEPAKDSPRRRISEATGRELVAAANDHADDEGRAARAA